MAYILAASSVHHAIDTFSTEQQSKYKEKVYAIPGLSQSLREKYEKNCAKFAFERPER